MSENTNLDTGAPEPKSDKEARRPLRADYWKRLLFMVGYGFIGYFVLIALFLVAIVQAVYTLVTGAENGELKDFARNLTRYLGEVMAFVSWASEEKPFPAKAFAQANPNAADASI